MPKRACGSAVRAEKQNRSQSTAADMNLTVQRAAPTSPSPDLALPYRGSRRRRLRAILSIQGRRPRPAGHSRPTALNAQRSTQPDIVSGRKPKGSYLKNPATASQHRSTDTPKPYAFSSVLFAAERSGSDTDAPSAIEPGDYVYRPWDYPTQFESDDSRNSANERSKQLAGPTRYKSL